MKPATAAVNPRRILYPGSSPNSTTNPGLVRLKLAVESYVPRTFKQALQLEPMVWAYNIRDLRI